MSHPETTPIGLTSSAVRSSRCCSSLPALVCIARVCCRPSIPAHSIHLRSTHRFGDNRLKSFSPQNPAVPPSTAPNLAPRSS